MNLKNEVVLFKIKIIDENWIQQNSLGSFKEAHNLKLKYKGDRSFVSSVETLIQMFIKGEFTCQMG